MPDAPHNFSDFLVRVLNERSSAQERHHARTRRELLRIDDHLSDMLAFAGRPE